MKKNSFIFTFLLIFLPFNYNFYSQNKPLVDNKTEEIENYLEEIDRENNLEIFLIYFTEILGPVVALIGLWYTIPLLRKKLTEDHISTSLGSIQLTNSNIQQFNQKLIDDYHPLAYTNHFLKKVELEAVYDEIKKGYQISLEGSSDVATIMFYLKTTLAGAIRNYEESGAPFFSRTFYPFIITLLELINFFSTQAVQIPQSSQTIKKDLIKKDLKKYVTNAHIIKYKHFHRGVIEDPHSVHFLKFIEEVNHSNLKLLMRSAFQINWNPCAIAKLLYVNKIYAPLNIQGPKHFLFDQSASLFLIGFTKRQIINENGKKNVVDLLYSNPDDNLAFVSNLKQDQLITKYNDCWIPTSGFELIHHIKLNIGKMETLQLRFDQEYLEKLFLKNKRQIKKKLK